MIEKIKNKKTLIFLLAFIAVFIESFSLIFLKIGGQYNFLSGHFILYYCLAIAVMGIYSVMWQTLLELLPLSTAYLRKGLSYIFAYLWAFIFFDEIISIYQIIGGAIIIIGMVVSQHGNH